MLFSHKSATCVLKNDLATYRQKGKKNGVKLKHVHERVCVTMERCYRQQTDTSFKSFKSFKLLFTATESPKMTRT